ncbi:hypothetical protein ACFLQ2_00160 [archaeon]
MEKHVLGFIDPEGNDTGRFVVGTRVDKITDLNFLPLLGSRRGRNRDVVSVKTHDGRFVYKFTKNIPTEDYTVQSVDEKIYPLLEESIPCAKHEKTIELPYVEYKDDDGAIHTKGMRVIVEEDVGHKNLSEERFNIHVSKKGLKRMKRALRDITNHSITMIQKGLLLDIKPENFVLKQEGWAEKLLLVDKDHLVRLTEENRAEKLATLGKDIGRSFADLYLLNDPLLDAKRYEDIKDYLTNKIRSWTIAPPRDLDGNEMKELSDKDAKKIINGMDAYLTKKFHTSYNELYSAAKLKINREPTPSIESSPFKFTGGKKSEIIRGLKSSYKQKTKNIANLEQHIMRLEMELQKGSDIGLISAGRKNQINRSFHHHKLAMMEAKMNTFNEILDDLEKAKPKTESSKKEVDKTRKKLKRLLSDSISKYTDMNEAFEKEELAIGDQEAVKLNQYIIPFKHNEVVKTLALYKQTMAGTITKEAQGLEKTLRSAEEQGQLEEGTAARLGVPMAMQNLSLLENEYDLYENMSTGLKEEKNELMQSRYDEFRYLVETQSIDGLLESIRRNKKRPSVEDYLETNFIGKQIKVVIQNKDVGGFQWLLKSMSEGELDELSKAVSSLPKQSEDALDYNIKHCKKQLDELVGLIAPVKELTDKYYQ